MISCLCNVLFTELQHDTTLDSLSALDREISLKNITGGCRGGGAPLAHEGGAILSFGPTFDVKGKR